MKQVQMYSIYVVFFIISWEIRIVVLLYYSNKYLSIKMIEPQQRYSFH